MRLLRVTSLQRLCPAGSQPELLLIVDGLLEEEALVPVKVVGGRAVAARFPPPAYVQPVDGTGP